jgi:hypothetical protein
MIWTECSLWSTWAAFGGGGAGEGGEIGVAGEIAAATDAVHQLPAHDVCAIHVAEDIDFDGSVDGDDAEAADHFGIVADLLWAEHDPGAEPIEVVVDPFEDLVGDGERAAAGEGDAFALDQFDDGLLDDLGVHLEGRDLRVAAERQEDGIGDIAHAGLDGKKALGEAACDQLACQEFGDVLADLFCGGVAGGEGARFVLQIGLDDADDLFGGDGNDGRADAVAGGVDRDLAAGRRARKYRGCQAG